MLNKLLILLIFIYSNNIYACKCSKKTLLLDNKIVLLSKLTKCKLKITSGYRTKLKNTQVGGVINSLHLKNLARDIVIINNCKYTYMQLGEIASLIIPGVIVYPNHIHVDMRKKRYFGKKTLKGFKNLLTDK